MRFQPRVLFFGLCALAGLAACSGSFGSGTGLPNTIASPSFGGPSSPSPTPNNSSVILTYGTSTDFQSLGDVGGYGGAIAFPKAADPSPAPSPKGKNATPAPAPTPVAVAIGATLSVVKPNDGPDLNFESGKGRRRKTREHPARALAYITLLPTHDAILDTYPRIAIDIPREIASEYRDGEFGLALWNSGEKDSRFRLAVAELDTATTPPPRAVAATTAAPNPGGSAKPGSSAAPSGAPTASASPSRTTGPAGIAMANASPGASGAPAPSAAPTLPPQRILFAGTAATLKLIANRPAVFAIYALPHPATPAPQGSVAPSSSKKSAPAPASPAASGSPQPAASAAASAKPT